MAEQYEWWKNPWWENTTISLEHPAEEITRAAKHLLPACDDKWIQQVLSSNVKKGKNFLIPALIWGRSTSDASLVFRLGTMVNRLAPMPGFIHQLNALKSPEGAKSEATFLELETADTFVAKGLSIRFPGEGNGRSYDIGVETTDIPVAIECKFFQKQEWEDWSERLQLQLISQLPSRHEGKDIAVSVELYPRLSELRLEEPQYAGANEAIRNALVRAVCTVIEDSLKTGELPIFRELPGLATFKIELKTEQSNGAILDREDRDASRTRRILQKIADEAIRQLPDDRPGIIVIRAYDLPSRLLLSLAFSALIEQEPETYDKLAAVLVHQAQYMFSPYRKPFLLLNRGCRWDATTLEAVRILKEAYVPDADFEGALS